MGQIVTFYSFKGGIGRSMAVANVATLLSQWGYKTLIVDWDLEAPGIENYFKDFINLEIVQKKKGLIELLCEKLENWKELCIEVNVTKSQEPSHILTAGDRSRNYLEKVRNWDIQSFFSTNEGGLFIESLRNEWKETYDYILVDSRTGVTDTAAICTIQLPDILVAFFSANDQSFDGVLDIIKKANKARQKLPFERLNLTTIPIPSRFDSVTEYELSKQWLKHFSGNLTDIYSNWLPSTLSSRIEDVLEITKIPYISYFSFGEKLPVLDRGTTDPGGLGYSYETLAALIVNNFEKVEMLVENRDSYVIQAQNHNITVEENNVVAEITQKPATSPRPLDYFIGRKKILAEVKSILTKESSSGALAFIGMGGIGKTALAIQIAYNVNYKFPDNIFWGDLNKFEGDAIQILLLWADYCGHKLPTRASGQDLANTVRGLLTERQKNKGPILVVIDDLRETWLEAGELLNSAIPANTPIIITTREISVAQYLKVSKIFNLNEHLLSDSEACDMLIARSNHKLDIHQAKIIAELCEKMPLALELAAQVANVEGAKYLLEKLGDASKSLDVLQIGSRARKDTSVKITFEISYDALPTNAALAFRYLGAFAPNAITELHLSAVFSYSKKNIDVDNELRTLRRYSFLQNSDYSGESSTYHMHTLLHDYSQYLLKGREATEARQGHFTCFQNFAHIYSDLDLVDRNDNKIQTFEIFLPQMIQALVNFEQEYKLKDSKLKITQLRSTIEFIDILDKYWIMHDSFDNQVKWLGLAYSISSKINLPLKQADFARRIGRVKGWQGELTDGLKWMKRCDVALDVSKSKEANAIRAQMYIHRASINYQKGSLISAKKDCMNGVKIVTEKGYPRIFAEGYNLLGVINLRMDKLSLALEAFKKSLLAWKRTEDQYQISRVEDNVRSTLYYLGKISDLREAEEEGLRYWKQFPDRMEYAAALTNRGLVYYIDEKYETAVALHKNAIEISDTLGSARLRALTRVNLASPYISLGKLDEAVAILNESLRIQEEYGIMEYELDAKRCLAEVEIGRRNYIKAIELAQLVVKLAQEDDDPLEEGSALRVLGQANHLIGDLLQARSHLEKSLSLLRDNEYKHESYLTLQALSELYHDMGDIKKAHATYAETQSLATEMGVASIGSRAVHI